jgi:hypothetical protein
MPFRRERRFQGWKRKKALPDMETTLWIIVAVVIVIAMVAYLCRKEIGLKFKG